VHFSLGREKLFVKPERASVVWVKLKLAKKKNHMKKMPIKKVMNLFGLRTLLA
jgi:hypothetical protein